MIHELEGDWPLSLLCDTLRVSRSAYYAWRRGEPSARQQADQQLGPIVRGVFWEHKRRYGARRIAVLGGGIHCAFAAAGRTQV